MGKQQLAVYLNIVGIKSLSFIIYCYACMSLVSEWKWYDDIRPSLRIKGLCRTPPTAELGTVNNIFYYVKKPWCNNTCGKIGERWEWEIWDDVAVEAHPLCLLTFLHYFSREVPTNERKNFITETGFC